MVLVLVALAFSGCGEPVEVDKGLCVQRCVNRMLELMADADHNQFSAAAIREAQITCERNLEHTRCYIADGGVRSR